MPDSLPRIAIYTDGGSKPNPGPGGWGAVFVQDRRVVRELCGGDPETTNNRMELLGAIEALDALDGPHDVVVHTDSRYVENGITRWIDGWRRRGWVRFSRWGSSTDESDRAKRKKAFLRSRAVSLT